MAKNDTVDSTRGYASPSISSAFDPKNMKYSIPEGYERWPVRYLVFGYDTDYPKGGWNDFQGAFVLLEDAQQYVTYGNKCQIVDLQTRRVIHGDVDDSARYVLEEVPNGDLVEKAVDQISNRGSNAKTQVPTKS